MRGPSESATHIGRTDCPHLSDSEWEALQRLATVIGEAAVATMLRTLSPTEQHGVALGFIVKEQRDAAAATTTTASFGTTPRMQSLKPHVSNYVGKEGEPLLRWLAEVDTAIAARRTFDDPSKVAFAMPCLGGRARSWVYGHRLAEFKEELRQAFEPPKNEFQSRAEFLDLQQFKHDVHAYAQRARYLVSNIVTNPKDEAIKVVTFMKGLRDGPVKTYLFREYPSTLEAAITLAMQEEFSLRQAKLHVNVPRMARPVMRTGGPNLWTSRTLRLLVTSSGTTVACGVSDADTPDTMRVSAQRLCTRPGADVAMPGIAAINKKTRGTSRRGAPYW
ncbi:hypothetical protein PI124_g23300 [Phytophthora idaei]|nr:hypothetical protein PI124_g23300 [Phytophthora idaei]